MKKFLSAVFIFSLFLGAVIIFVYSKADGYADSFYLRFTSPKQSSLILGTSRAAQGVMPSKINPYLTAEAKKQGIYNYSFTIGHSPYGEAYYNSITRKLNPDTKNGVFIVTIDPWAVSTKNADPNDSENFGEREFFIEKVKVVDMKPNLFYLMDYEQQNLNLITNRYKKVKETFLHNDGWLEINVPMDSMKVEKRLKQKIVEYTDNAQKYKFSDVRYEYFVKTIELLKKHGTVYIVRLPVANVIHEIEDNYVPGFEQRVATTAQRQNVKYLSYYGHGDKYEFTDGNHLYKTSAAEISNDIGARIKADSK